MTGCHVPIDYVERGAVHCREQKLADRGWPAPYASGLATAGAAESWLPDQGKFHALLWPWVAAVGNSGPIGHLFPWASTVCSIVDSRWWGAGDLWGEREAIEA